MNELLASMQRDGVLARKLLRHLRNYHQFREQNDYPAALLEKRLQSIQLLVDSLSESSRKDELKGWLTAEYEWLRRARDEARFRLGSELKAALEELGYALSGQLPLLRIGCYTLKIDFGSGHAALFWGPEVERIRTRIPIAVKAITAAIAAADSGLRTQETDPETFLKRLLTAYDRQRLARHLPDGSRVMLVDLLRELAFMNQTKKFFVDPTRENYRGYSRVQYSYDLYQLKKAGKSVIGGRRLQLAVATFDATTERMRSLWVPINDQGEGSYYSYIAFTTDVPENQPTADTDLSRLEGGDADNLLFDRGATTV